jgi:tRNA 2-thiouridine synthesizing protein A
VVTGSSRTLDVRGLSCPLPLLRARAALAPLAPGDRLVVLATDPEAPIDLAALAADGGHGLRTAREAAHWRLELTRGPAAPAPPHARGGAEGERGPGAGSPT